MPVRGATPNAAFRSSAKVLEILTTHPALTSEADFVGQRPAAELSTALPAQLQDTAEHTVGAAFATGFDHGFLVTGISALVTGVLVLALVRSGLWFQQLRRLPSLTSALHGCVLRMR
ncbi:hypothetical protein MOQ72_26105 [Saccharopolyspora sp. K220]|uniref:hypothetical protein n=1 Tax=Saccharopolyspora soli TaxID=2926618 RepID=UPI001F584F1A|nr:hypothetical protein [Saccharopolyspora soli]MCI2420922.1 hypothetical protein [Saccharopolyspora soli]